MIYWVGAGAESIKIILDASLHALEAAMLQKYRALLKVKGLCLKGNIYCKTEIQYEQLEELVYASKKIMFIIYGQNFIKNNTHYVCVCIYHIYCISI